MYARGETLVTWLRHRRQDAQLRQYLMGEKFDLDGALAGGQPELAWRAGQQALLVAVELYLHERGVRYDDIVGDERVERAGALFDAVRGLDERLAGDAWHLLLRPCPADEAGLAAALRDTAAFAADRLGVPFASRDEAIRGWAESTELLREVARAIGIADSETWYLTGTDDPVGWYEHVLSVLDAHR